MKKQLLESVDQAIFDWLEVSVDIVPNRIVKLVAFYYTDARIRKLYLRRLGVVMGEGTYANLGLKIAVDCVSSEPKIIIGNNVSIAPNVTFIADACANNGNEINEIPYVRDKLTVQGKICVEDEAWLGAGVTVMPNVTIGRCSIIGAGSVVLNDVEPYSIYAGVPAKKVRDLRCEER